MEQRIGGHCFGGQWTIEKLDIFSGYLDFYVTALKNQKFNRLYIDAFAGTGSITTNEGSQKIEGSIRIALNAKNKFDKYIFIEKKKKYYTELTNVVNNEYDEYKDRVEVVNGDCNVELERICNEIDWRYNRALMLLDPYATDVSWDTLKIVAETKAIDVWYLFPISAVRECCPKKEVQWIHPGRID